MTDPCPDCPPTENFSWKNGRCYWHRCETPATEVVHTDGVNHRGRFFPTGDIELCAGHLRRFERLGRLDLDWDVILPALARVDRGLVA